MLRLLISAVLSVAFWLLCLLLAPSASAAAKPVTPKASPAVSVKSKAESLGPIGVIRAPLDNDTPDAMADWRIVNASYFSVVGLPLLKGRNFAAADSREAPRVAIVDESLAQRLWPGQEAVGRRLRIEGESTPWMTVIGVVRHQSGGALESATHGQLYFPYPENTTADDSDD